MQKITLVAAIDRNLGIGLANQLPWHIPEDLEDFKRYTINKPMIMGRNSFESLNNTPLPKRPTVVLSRTLKSGANFTALRTLQAGIDHFSGAEEIIIAGGHNVYKEALEVCTHMRLTHIRNSFKVDTYFPKFNTENFSIEQITPLLWQANPSIKVEIISYRRIDNPHFEQ